MVMNTYYGFTVNWDTKELRIEEPFNEDSRKIITYLPPSPDKLGYTDGEEYRFSSKNFFSKYLEAFEYFGFNQEPYNPDGTCFKITISGYKTATINEYTPSIYPASNIINTSPFHTNIYFSVNNAKQAYNIMRGLKVLGMKTVSYIEEDNGDPTKEDVDRAKTHELTCIKCGKAFKANRKDRQYCSKECYDNGRKR